MTDIYWTTETRLVKDLVPYQNNPRKMSKEQARQLIESIKKFNYVELVAVQPDNRIIAGHMRIRALMQLGKGKDSIEVRVPSRALTEDEMREYLIRSNKNQGDWDWDELSSAWGAEDLVAWGFTAEELVDNILFDGSAEPDEKEECEKCSACGQKLKKKKAKDHEQ